MTLKELSKLSNVSSGLISSIERGLVNPSIDVVIKICGSLNIDPNHLIHSPRSKGKLMIMKRKDQYAIADEKGSSFIVSPTVFQRV